MAIAMAGVALVQQLQLRSERRDTSEAMAEVMAPKLPIQNRTTKVISPKHDRKSKSSKAQV